MFSIRFRFSDKMSPKDEPRQKRKATAAPRIVLHCAKFGKFVLRCYSEATLTPQDARLMK